MRSTISATRSSLREIFERELSSDDSAIINRQGWSPSEQQALGETLNHALTYLHGYQKNTARIPDVRVFVDVPAFLSNTSGGKAYSQGRLSFIGSLGRQVQNLAVVMGNLGARDYRLGALGCIRAFVLTAKQGPLKSARCDAFRMRLSVQMNRSPDPPSRWAEHRAPMGGEGQDGRHLERSGQD